MLLYCNSSHGYRNIAKFAEYMDESKAVMSLLREMSAPQYTT